MTPLPELRRPAVRSCRGTGAGCTTNRFSLTDDMRIAALLQRVRLTDGRARDAATALELGTSSGAEVLGATGRRLVQLRQHQGRRVQHEADHEKHDASHQECAVTEEADLDDGLFVAELPKVHCYERDDCNDSKDHDIARLKPIFAF